MPGGLLFAPTAFGPTIKITSVTLTTISTVVVLLRFYCRIWVVGKLKSYDYLIAPALLSVWTLCAINFLQVEYGSGTLDSSHQKSDPARKNIRQAAAVWFAYQLIYPVVPALVKLSILFFYRTFATNLTFRILVHATMVLVSAYTVGIVLVTAFECPHKPSLAYYERIFTTRKQYGCLPVRKLYLAQAYMNIVTDIIVFVLPLPVLVKLRMATHKRVGLLFLFSIGLLVPIAAAFRISAVSLWSKASYHEQRYYGGYLIFWDHVEANTAIICASVPSLQPLFRGLFGRVFMRSSYLSYYYGQGETTTTQMTIGRRASRRIETDITLTSPMRTYQPSDKKAGPSKESGVVLIRETEDTEAEEEIRNRVRAFTMRPRSANSYPPKSPARPRDILASG